MLGGSLRHWLGIRVEHQNLDGSKDPVDLEGRRLGSTHIVLDEMVW